VFTDVLDLLVLVGQRKIEGDSVIGKKSVEDGLNEKEKQERSMWRSVSIYWT